MFTSRHRTQTISRYQREQERKREEENEIKVELKPGELAGDCSQGLSQTPVINILSGI